MPARADGLLADVLLAVGMVLVLAWVSMPTLLRAKHPHRRDHLVTGLCVR